MRPARLADVAALAGVSTATVSRAFNQPEKVSPDVRARVDAAAASLGWVPHAAARALASSRSHIAGVVVPNLGHAIFAHQIEAMQSVFAAHGMTLFIGCTDYDASRAVAQVRAMLARGVEAIAIVGEDHPAELFAALTSQRVPYVLTYVYRPGCPHPCVGFDNARAFRRIVDRLIALGHRDFGLVMQTTAGNDRATARRRAVQETLAEHGLAIRPQHYREGSWSIGFGRAALRAIMDAPGPRPTAVICGNDPLAIGALAEAHAMGIRVPEELSVTGFDDIELAAHTDPPLTSMGAPDADIGRRAAEYLLARLEGRTDAIAAIELEPVLVERASTAPAPAAAAERARRTPEPA